MWPDLGSQVQVEISLTRVNKAWKWRPTEAQSVCPHPSVVLGIVTKDAHRPCCFYKFSSWERVGYLCGQPGGPRRVCFLATPNQVSQCEG
jgi:hypothetical protein